MTSRSHLRTAQRIVVKLGTHVVTHPKAGLAIGRLSNIIESVATLQHQGKHMILVSSGAVGMGQRLLSLPDRPRSLGMVQACAAVGQGQLIAFYSQIFKQLDIQTAQVLLTQNDFRERDRLLCLRTTLMRLIELGVVPIINENDSVSVRELIEYDAGSSGSLKREFGDNDGLSARVATVLDADLLVLLTDVDGVFTANPSHESSAERIDEIVDIDENIKALAQGSSIGGTGGMLSKLEAASLATSNATSVLITSGHIPQVLERALQAESLGTLFPAKNRRATHHRSILFAGAASGALIANQGALTALCQQKASLLPAGLLAVEGDFAQGDIVEVRDAKGHVFARGLVNYDARACNKLIGKQSSEIARLIGWKGYNALISRDNLVLLSE